jgi:hypothetical protein
MEGTNYFTPENASLQTIDELRGLCQGFEGFVRKKFEFVESDLAILKSELRSVKIQCEQLIMQTKDERLKRE